MRILFCFGTRPEAIKLAPLILEMNRRPDLEVKVCLTGQHRQMLDQVMEIFQLGWDYDLDLMTEGHTLPDLTGRVLAGVSRVIEEVNPDLMVVQGDTTTAAASALAGFYQKVPVAHVEAGLRTFDIYSPFPEEVNRRLISVLATWHFAPTERSRAALLAEGVKPEAVHVVGNTVVDALRLMTVRLENSDSADFPALSALDFSRRVILVTGHRRESFGAGFRDICEALRTIALRHPDVEIAYPVHLNPQVQKPVRQVLSDLSNVHLLPPLDYIAFIWLLNRCDVVLTDSGGVQEEAPSLGKPVLVMRETTERPEVIEANFGKLVGTDRETIVSEVEALLDETSSLGAVSGTRNPYGDGTSAVQITDILARTPGARILVAQ